MGFCFLCPTPVAGGLQVRVEVEALFDGIDLSEPLTRARFEELNIDLFRKTLGPVKKARPAPCSPWVYSTGSMV